MRRPVLYGSYALLAAVALAVPALCLNGAFNFGHTLDSFSYAQMIRVIARQIGEGIFFPSWHDTANGGSGTAHWMYYSTFAYWLAALATWWMAPLDPFGDWRLLVAMWAALTLGAATTCAWLKPYFGRDARWGGALFIVLPYVLFFTQVHSNFGALAAMAVLPLWLHATDRLRWNIRYGASLYAACMGALLLCHPASFVTTCWIPPLYAAFGGATWRARMRVWRRMVMPTVLGAGLAMVYALPAILAADWRYYEIHMHGKFDVFQNFFSDIEMRINWYMAVFAIAALFLLRCSKMPLRLRRERMAVCMIWMIAVIVFMVSPLSAFVWHAVPLLQQLQFPAVRFYPGAHVAALWLILWVWQERPRVTGRRREIPALAFVALASCEVIVCVLLTMLVHANVAQIPTPEQRQAMAQMEYAWTRNFDARWKTFEDERAVDRYLMAPVVGFITGKGTAQAERLDPRHWRMHAQVTSAEARLCFKQTYVPAWRASGGVELSPSTGDGWIEFKLPRGVHDVTMALDAWPGERWGERITLASLIILLFLLRADRRKGVPHGAVLG